MTDEISYFDVAAFLAEIEPDYERYLDPIEPKSLDTTFIAVYRRYRNMAFSAAQFRGRRERRNQEAY